MRACLLLALTACSSAPVLTPEAAPPQADVDGDGVADVDDVCPEIPGTVRGRGCPVEAPEAPPVAVAREVLCDDDEECEEAGHVCVRECEDGDEDEDEGEGCPGRCQPARVAATPPPPPPPPPAPSAAPKPAPIAAGGRLPPVEKTTKGDGKLLAATQDVTRMVDTLARQVAAVTGCEGRARAIERWAVGEGRHSHRLSARVRFLTARRNADYTPAELAAVLAHQTAYERLGEALSSCESEPAMARLESLDVDLAPTFHRSPDKDRYSGDARCRAWREIRTRALEAPETLIGRTMPDGSSELSVEVQWMGCFVNGQEWKAGTAELVVACLDLGRTEQRYMRHPLTGDQEDVWAGRLDHYRALASRCFGVADVEGRYTQESRKPLRLVSEDGTHTINAAKAEKMEGRFLWSLFRKR